MYVLIIF